jgi:hypothetical protein
MFALHFRDQERVRLILTTVLSVVFTCHSTLAICGSAHFFFPESMVHGGDQQDETPGE